VERIEVVVGDGPVFQRAAFRRAIGGAHLEVLGHVAPGLRAVAESPAAHAGGIVGVGSLAGQEGMQLALGANDNARISIVVGAEGVAQDGGALVAQVVFAAVVGDVPLSAFQQDHAEAGDGQFLGHDAAPGPGSYDDCVYLFHEGEPFLVCYWARPSNGGTSRPSIRQLTASRLPPWRGGP